MTAARRLRRLFGAAVAPAGRWVVLDVEASGLDARRDHLLAIAAVGVRHDAGALRIGLGDSFEAVLRQDGPQTDKGNILLHGIGVGAQRAGTEPRAALEAFAAWLDGAPRIGFHAAFDETLIQRRMQAELGHRLAGHGVDLEPVAAALLPDVKARSLDAWLAHFGIVCAARHQAAADALATAELLLRLWPLLRRQQPDADFPNLRRLAAHGRWLQR